MITAVTSKELQQARRIAKRSRAIAACMRCKHIKTKCSDYRPCRQCMKVNRACSWSTDIQRKNLDTIQATSVMPIDGDHFQAQSSLQQDQGLTSMHSTNLIGSNGSQRIYSTFNDFYHSELMRSQQITSDQQNRNAQCIIDRALLASPVPALFRTSPGPLGGSLRARAASLVAHTFWYNIIFKKK